MKQMTKTVLNWSGGKDSAVALNRLRNDHKFSVDLLLTSVNTNTERVTMHGVRRELILRQADAIGIPAEFLELPDNPSLEQYRTAFRNKINELTGRGFEFSAFGDIHLEDLREYRNELLVGTGMEAAYPIWHMNPVDLTREFIRSGFRALLVCVNREKLDESFTGSELDQKMLDRLPGDVDPCGENGEYHSFVYDGPIFNHSVSFERGKRYQQNFPDPGNEANEGAEIRFDYLDLF